ncbi:MAG: ribosome small subunit-dependent GTPase A [Spirochaetales bacterium]|nr:ribosome small subunit-dependent GTPase A [Spirochaetales bacterium]
MTGTVLRSINNIYSVRNSGGEVYSCRIKGKQLSQAKGEYNPIVVGDVVDFTPGDAMEGLVTYRHERRSAFARWNDKRSLNQTICSNMDVVACVCSVESPPFRPRFIDRVIACCKGVQVMIVLNKCDILLTEEELERFTLYKKLGYQTVSVSAETGENVKAFVKLLEGKTVAFVGQSGVGKSSLVNRILGTSQKVGDLNAKYNRGNHTTNHALMLDGPGFTLIDTPGFREISVPHDDPRLVASSFPEMAEASAKCAYDGCLHVNEPGCEVIRLVEKGKINADRYESYLRILDSMEDRLPVWGRKCSKGQ